MKMYRKASVII